tara:strand:- start:1582 stop:2931 length:1350 start_codon:yes stop_codon:yes gene_type:complete
MSKFLNLFNFFIFKELNLFVLWFLILLGINVNTDHLIINNNENLVDWVYSSRAYLQFIILSYLIYKNLTFLNKLEKVNYFFLLFILYNLIQIISLFLSENSNLNLIYNVCSLNVLLFLNFIFSHKNNEIKKIFYLLFFLLTLIYFYFYFEKLYYLLFEDKIFYGHYHKDALLVPIQNAPRSSGIGRLALVLLLFFVIFFNTETIKNKIIVSLLLAPGIFLTQSRTIIAIYFIIILIFSFGKYFKFLRILHFKNFIYNILLFFIIPLIFSLFLSNLKSTNFEYIKNNINETFLKKENSQETLKLKEDKEYKILRDINPQSVSSHRFRDWQRLTQYTFSNSFFFGDGTQSDRFIIKQTASSALIYIYSSSGIFGLIIYFVILYNIFKIFFKKNSIVDDNHKNDKNFILSLLIIITLLLRSLLESSFAVFGIDYILFIISLFVLNHVKESKN